MNIKAENICKVFGSRSVLNNISYNIAGGSIYCLLGRNGAGKSTIINIMADLLELDKGYLTIDNRTFKDQGIQLKKIIGLQSQYDQLIEELNAFDYLEMIGLIYKVEKTELFVQIKNLLSYFFDDGEDLLKTIKGYSTGMKKKIAICAAFVHKPDILLLDEPFANLDPIVSYKLCKLMNAYINKERIVFISSHDLLYVNKVATHIGILDNGQLVFNNTLDAFKNHTGESLDANLLKYLNPKQEGVQLLAEII